MSFFEGANDAGAEKVKDRLGGGFQPKETDLYNGTIKVAYGSQAASGARALNLTIELPGGEYRETVYVTSGTAKGGKSTYKDKDGTVRSLPGFTIANDLSLLVAGKPLEKLDAEKKYVKIYDPAQKIEVPTEVPVFVELVDQPVSLGIFQNLENKSEKDGNGNYVPTAETRVTNSIGYVFHAETGQTRDELENEQEPTFRDAWVAKYRGQQRDQRKLKGGAGGVSGRPGGGTAPAAGGASGGARKPLFPAKG